MFAEALFAARQLAADNETLALSFVFMTRDALFRQIMQEAIGNVEKRAPLLSFITAEDLERLTVAGGR